jgi:hypothetical protein
MMIKTKVTAAAAAAAAVVAAAAAAWQEPGVGGAAAQRRQWQRQCGGSSAAEAAAAAASLAAKATTWRNRDFGGDRSALGSAAAGRQRQLRVGRRHDLNQSGRCGYSATTEALAYNCTDSYIPT